MCDAQGYGHATTFDRGFFLDTFGLLGFRKNIISLLAILFQVVIPDQNLYGILEVDAILGVVSMALVQPTVFGLVIIGLGRCLSRKMDSNTFELVVSTFGQDFFL